MFGRFGNVVAGLWLVIAPFVLGYADPAARTSDFWSGLAVIAIALISTRISGIRWINAGLGAWVVAAPWILSYETTRAVVNDVVVGLLIIALAVVPTFRRVESPLDRRRTVSP